MAWEIRAGRRYYYRKRRVGRRVASIYVGSDLVALNCAQRDDTVRRRQEAQQERVRAERERERQIAQQVDSFAALVRGVTGGELLLAGCYTHHGQWRKEDG